MKTLRVLSLTLAFAALTATVAAAQTATPGIDLRQERQELRIRQGVRSGELTRGEAMRLQAGERRIERMKLRAERDGAVTHRERLRLARALDRESRRIYRLKHNAVTR